MEAVPRDSGFTLIEVVGAALIFAVALMMVTQLSKDMGSRLERSALVAEVVTVARERLDSLDALDYGELSIGSSSDTLLLRGVSYEQRLEVTQYGPLLRETSVRLEPVSARGPDYAASSFKADAW